MLNMLLWGTMASHGDNVIPASLFPLSGSLSTMTGGFSLGIMLDNSRAGGRGEEGGGSVRTGETSNTQSYKIISRNIEL